jgi:hypothetical protein
MRDTHDIHDTAVATGAQVIELTVFHSCQERRELGART